LNIFENAVELGKEEEEVESFKVKQMGAEKHVFHLNIYPLVN
jgi:hypothetical protein